MRSVVVLKVGKILRIIAPIMNQRLLTY